MPEHLVEGFRLSPQQRRLWRLQESEGAGSYVAQSAVLIEGALRPEILRAATEQVVNQHEILRTTFQTLSEMDLPLQVIGEGRVDWRQEQRLMNGSLNDDGAQLEALLNQAKQTSAAMESAPPFRVSLFALADDKHFFIVTLPALQADVATLQKLVSEIGTVYAALLRREQRDADVIQYADLSEWQNELLESEEMNPGQEYWRRQEPQPARLLKFPYENCGVKAGYKPCRLAMSIPARLVSELKELASTEGCSMQALLLACWQTLLWRLTGEPLIISSAAFDGRQYAGTENALGLCARYLPIRSQLDSSLSLADVAKELEETLKEVGEWQEYFIEETELSSSGESRDGLRVGFDYLEWPRQFQFADLSLSFYELYSNFDRFDLKLSCIQKEETILAEFHYDAAAFEESAVSRLAGNFLTLLGSAVAHPHRSLGRLEILSDDERRLLLVEWNATQTPYPSERCFQHLFEEQAARTPDEIAVSCGTQRLTYRELDKRSNQLAHYLRQRGVHADTIVGICMERSPDLIVGLLGILKAGGAYLPLDPAYPSRRLAFMLEDAQVPLLLTQSLLVASLPATPAERILLDEDWTAIAESSEQSLSTDARPEHLAYVIYTSGSTGTPKGTLIHHRGLVNYLTWCLRAYPVEAGCGALIHSSISFDLTITGLFAPLLAGRAVRLVPEDLGFAGLGEVLQNERDLSLVKLTPSHLRLINQQLEPHMAAGRTRAFIIGGENLLAELLNPWRDAAPETLLFNEYGPTETVVGCCVYRVQPRTQRSGAVPIGRPIANTELYVLDTWMQPVPFGVPGELYVGGAGVARGYLNRPELTAARFVPHPFSLEPGQRLYRTGDRACYESDGTLLYLGRDDEQVKVRGFRIELGEIEAALQLHPDVQAAAAALKPTPDGEPRLVAYVVQSGSDKPATPLAPEASLVEKLRAFLKERLPDSMLPTAFVLLDALPLTSNGKVDRTALEPPENFSRAAGEEYRAPRNRTEEVLSGIWAEILGVEKVGINDNFFESGGDSIRGIQAIARANRAGIHLTPHQLFQHQTIAELAAVAGSAPVVQTAQGVLTGSVKLTPIQRWFFEQDLPEPHHFNQSVLLEVRPALNFSLLEKAVSLLLPHHDALRLRFERTPSGWQQSYESPTERVPVSQITLPSPTEEEYQSAIEAHVAELQTTLNLARGSISRFTLFHSSAGLTDRLHVAVHHLAVDGVSWRILLEDLQLCYEQLALGEDVLLPLKTTSYQYWAERLSDYAQSETLRQEAAYWLAEGEAFNEPLPLDFSREQRSHTLAAARIVSCSLSPTETKALLTDVPRSRRVLIDDILLTALARSFAQWTRTNSLLMCMESHGRHELFADVDLSRTVGWFTALFPVRVTLPGNADAGTELKAIKEQLRGVPNHGTGYGLLRYLSGNAQLVAQLERLPQPDVLFNYFGNLDQVLPASSLFSVCRQPLEHDRSLKTGRAFLLEVNAYVIDGQFTAEFTYSSNLHRRETIEALADAFIAALRRLIAYGQTTETIDYTPSDFPKSKLNQTELDHLLSKLMASRGGPA